jgi:hypothetical protein
MAPFGDYDPTLESHHSEFCPSFQLTALQGRLAEVADPARMCPELLAPETWHLTPDT